MIARVTIANESTTAEPPPVATTVGLIDFTGQMFALDSFVVKTHNKFSSRTCFLTFAMYHHREALINLILLIVSS